MWKADVAVDGMLIAAGGFVGIVGAQTHWVWSLPLGRRLQTNGVNGLAARRHRPDYRNALTLSDRGCDTTERGHVHHDLSAVAAEHEVVAMNRGDKPFNPLTILGDRDRAGCGEKQRGEQHAPPHTTKGPSKAHARLHDHADSPLSRPQRRKGRLKETS